MTQKLIERNRFVTQLVQREFHDLDRRYGTIEKSGDGWLPYHNASHGRDVHDFAVATAQKLATQGLISENDVPLVRIAAIFHDHEQDLGSGPNESKSADAATAALAERPDLFDETDMAKVRSMVMGTVVSFVDGRLVQAAKAANVLDAVVADADLGSLSDPSGPRQALHLLCEMESKAGRLTLPADALALSNVQTHRATTSSFLNFQERLLDEHRYLLDPTETERAPSRARNLELTRQLNAAHTDGAPFGELLDTSIAYAHGRAIDIGSRTARDGIQKPRGALQPPSIFKPFGGPRPPGVGRNGLA